MRKYLALVIIVVFVLMPNSLWAQEQQEQSWIQEQPKQQKQPVRYALKGILDFSGTIGFSGQFGDSGRYTHVSFYPEFGHFPHKGLRLGYGPTFFHDMENPPEPDNKKTLWGIGIKFSIGYVFYTKSVAYPFIKFGTSEIIAGLFTDTGDGMFLLTSFGPETGVTLTLRKVLINISVAYKVSLIELSDEEEDNVNHLILFKVGLGFWAQKGQR